MDIAKFLNEQFTARTETVQVPELAGFFAEGERAEWVVRGLTGAELGRANQASERSQENVKALVEAMAGKGDKAEALRRTLGISDEEIPTDVSRRIEMLTAASVSPKLGSEHRDVAVRLAETFPTIFYNLTNKVLNLTGQGSEVGKPKPSGKAEK